MLQATTQLGGVTEDVSYLVAKGPDVLQRIVDVVQKAGSYLPQVEQIVQKAASQIPNIAKIVDKGAKYIPTLLLIVEDPALPLVVERVRTLHEITKREKEAASAPGTGPISSRVGIGLDRVVAPLDTYIWTREHPWATKGMIAAGLASLVGVGFLLGRKTRRRR